MDRYGNTPERPRETPFLTYGLENEDGLIVVLDSDKISIRRYKGEERLFRFDLTADELADLVAKHAPKKSRA